MRILSQAAHSSNPIADAIAHAIRTGNFDMVGPSDDPTAIFRQIVFPASPRLVQKFWDRDCPVELDFEHYPYPGGRALLALGAGAWFEPWVSQEALAFCVAQIVPDGQRDLTPLAEWVRTTAKPGGAIAWRDPTFKQDPPQPTRPPMPSWRR